MSKLIGMALATASLLACAAATDSARASTFVVNIDQIGPNVVATGSGSVDLTGLTFNNFAFLPGIVIPNVADLLVGPATLGNVDVYAGVTGPSSFGPGGFTFASSGTGDLVGVSGGLGVAVPAGYMSGNPMSASMTFLGATFGSLGLTPGTYTSTWDTTDSFVINIGTSPPETPLPAALRLFATGLGALSLLGSFRKRKARADILAM
jgi:hypothetical protein